MWKGRRIGAIIAIGGVVVLSCADNNPESRTQPASSGGAGSGGTSGDGLGGSTGTVELIRCPGRVDKHYATLDFFSQASNDVGVS
jgi:hypothetical protein